MNSKNSRILFWSIILVISLVAVQWKKSVILEKQGAKSISILSEKLKNGEPVDVWAVEFEEFVDLQTISLTGDTRSKNAEFYISRQVRDSVELGAKVIPEINQESIGRVSTIAKEASFQNGMYKVEVIVKDPSLFKSKSFVSSSVVLKARNNSIMVPINSVSLEKDKAFVWVVEKDLSVKKEIQLADSNPQFYLVKSGLELNDLLVVKGNSLLSDGTKVRIRKKLNFKELASNHEVIQ